MSILFTHHNYIVATQTQPVCWTFLSTTCLCDNITPITVSPPQLAGILNTDPFERETSCKSQTLLLRFSYSFQKIVLPGGKQTKDTTCRELQTRANYKNKTELCDYNTVLNYLWHGLACAVIKKKMLV